MIFIMIIIIGNDVDMCAAPLFLCHTDTQQHHSFAYCNVPGCRSDLKDLQLMVNCLMSISSECLVRFQLFCCYRCCCPSSPPPPSSLCQSRLFLCCGFFVVNHSPDNNGKCDWGNLIFICVTHCHPRKQLLQTCCRHWGSGRAEVHSGTWARLFMLCCQVVACYCQPVQRHLILIAR